MNRRLFYRTHGYLVLRGFFGERETAALAHEVMAAISANHTVPAEPLAEATGVDGYYVPLMGPRSPTSRRLVADPRLLGLAEELLGPPALPKPAKGILYRDSSPWHSDSDDSHLTAVKMVTYFQPLAGTSGALRVLPGSHHPRYAAGLDTYRRSLPAAAPLDETSEAQSWPGVVLDSEPGDLIVFDTHVWHASLFGRDRTQWSVAYAAAPRTGEERGAVRRYISSFLDAGHVYDRKKYPYYDPDWRGDAAPAFASALAELGLLAETEL